MPGTFELKPAAGGDKYVFNLKAGNHEIILTSEVYESKAAAKNGIESVKKNASDDGRFERKEAKNGQLYFVLTATNGQVIGKSEMYTSASGRDNGIESVKKNAPSASIKELE
jgi:uncharacterized protein YegP (UPF0339 family)